MIPRCINKHFWFYFSVKINFLKHSKVFVLVWGVLLHGDFLVSKLELLDLIFNIFNLKITLLLLNVKTWCLLAQWRLNLINLLSLRAIRLSSWNIFIWLVVHYFMLLNLFIIINHVMPIRIWINTVRLFPFHKSILVLKIVNLIILILRIERGWNLPVGVHYIEINQIVINHILALW